MKNIIDNLIEQAGFSTTYEHERLQLLIKLTVKHCLECCTNQQSVTDIIKNLENEFDLKVDRT